MKVLELMHSYSLPLHGAERIWQHDFSSHLQPVLTPQQFTLIHEVFDAMADNASHYSHGSTLHIIVELSQNNIELTFQDNGMGIFKRIGMEFPAASSAFELLDAFMTRHPDCSLNQLCRQFDYVQIESNGKCFPAQAGADHQEENFNQGTAVLLALTLNH